MVQISEVKGNSRENRTAAHTHIKGLGLRGDGYAETLGAGFIGQVAAREVCGQYCVLHLSNESTANVCAVIRLAVLLLISSNRRRCQDVQYCSLADLEQVKQHWPWPYHKNLVPKCHFVQSWAVKFIQPR